MAHHNLRKIVGVGLLVLVLGALLPASDACMCMPAHPQTAYCQANYVIIARVIRQRIVGAAHNSQRVFKIDIKKTYKMNATAEGALRERKLYTSASQSMCGVEMTTGRLYFIAGNSQHINLCSFVKEYKSMTVVERRGFANGYAKGCQCKIEDSFDYHDEAASEPSCNWDYRNRCETHYGACFPSQRGRIAGERPTKCHWRSAPEYNKCMSIEINE